MNAHPMSRDTTSVDWWTSIRTTAFFAAAETEPEPELTADDIPLDQWSARRGELGLGGHDTGDFIGVDLDRASGLPSWRDHPVQPEPELSDLDRHRIEREGVIPDASDVFQAAPPRPRRNSSPWSV